MILDCNEIIENKLWVGCYIRPEEARILQQMGITTVISMQSDQDLDNYHLSQTKLLKAYGAAEIESRRIPTQDFDKSALLANLAPAVEELEKALRPRWARVYVHCTAGINRGPTLAAAYLIKSRGLSAQEAYDYVATRRYCNPYLDVLEAYEASSKNNQGRADSLSD
jgi:protein-tyrosine phosphatase